MIYYKIQKKASPKDDSKKYYLQMSKAKHVSLEEIVKRVEKRSTVSRGDVMNVLDALQFEVIECLRNGDTVRLGDLGTFYTTMSSQGVATEEEAKKKNVNLIKKLNVRYLRSKAMSEEVTPQKITIQRQPEPKETTTDATGSGD
ncbi:MAG: HU family DNA-binding protein [Bacteroidaceae bacterium]|nr:HU family DNA-binding protein [Bacteroidaceae bacterium]